MAIGLICNKCGTQLKVPEKFAGQYGECPHCHARIKIPMLPPEVEVHFCDNCEGIIPISETVHVHGGKLLCTKCYEKATGKKEKQAADNVFGQVDLNIPGMVMLKGKEERRLARLLQDVSAKEEFKRETRVVAKHEGALTCEKALGELLINKQMISTEQLVSAKEVQKESGLSLITILTKLGLLDEVKIASFLAREAGLLFTNAELLQIDKAVKALVQAEVMAGYEVIVLSRSGDTLTVAMVNPLDKEAIQEIEKRTKLRVKPVVCTKTAFKNTLAENYEM